jgi:hypothetical protein
MKWAENPCIKCSLENPNLRSYFSFYRRGRVFKTSFLVAVLFIPLLVCASTDKQALGAITSIDCAGFEAQLKSYEGRIQSKVRAWSDAYLSKANYQTVFYPFSGPDIVSALSLFPKANYYLLVADQVPEYAYLGQPEKSSESAQQFECSMLNGFARRGYYLTNDLNGKNGPKPRFIKLLIYNLAFSGFQVLDIRALKLNADGKLTMIQGVSEEARGVRFYLESKQGRKVTVDYVNADLANTSLEKTSGLISLLNQMSSQAVLLKSASHLLQNKNFSKLAGVLSLNATWIVQDETGLDIDVLASNFHLELFGKFVAPNHLWAGKASAQRLADYYATHSSKESLPFSIGYEKEGGSVLMIGNRK